MPNPDGEDGDDVAEDDVLPLHVAPDGGLEPELPEQKALRPPPRICEAGPCVHYHRFVEQLDAEQPKGARIEPGGKISGTAAPEFHHQTYHYCYPDVGIELELGGTPIYECNRWDPQDPLVSTQLVRNREKFATSDAGKTFEADQAAWRRELEEYRAVENAEDPLNAWVTMNLRHEDALEVFQMEPTPDGSPGKSLCSITSDVIEEIKSLTTHIGTLYGPGQYQVFVTRFDPHNPDTRMRVAVTKVSI